MIFANVKEIAIPEGSVKALSIGGVEVWHKQSDVPNYLCFTAAQAGSTISMTKTGTPPAVSVEYSTDGVSWNDFTIDETVVTLANIGDKVYFRGDNDVISGPNNGSYNNFVMTGKIEASGNVMSLLDKTVKTSVITGNRTFMRLFSGCASLTAAPDLPATTLGENCYFRMFENCTSLTAAPDLPATTLVYRCYRNMFENCTNLESIKAAFVDWGVDSTTLWVSNVAQTGVFYCKPDLPYMSGDNYIPTGWTVVTF